MYNESVLFKNSPDRLLLVLDGEIDFEKLIETINDKVSKNITFFQGYNLNLRYKGRQLTKVEEDAIVKSFTGLGVTVNEIAEEQIRLKKNIDFNKPLVKSKIHSSKRKNTRTMVNEFDEGFVSFYKGTIRSGQTINSNGTVVILGDVNPGADIKAKGNIIVMGKIRGAVSAGLEGNDKSFIIGRGIYPSSITISDVVAIPPEEEKRPVKKGFSKFKSSGLKQYKELEIAFVEEGNIYIDLYDNIY